MEALTQLEDGRWAATVDPGDGTSAQTFYGNTQNEVVNALIKAQANATKKIREQGRLIKTQKNSDPKERSIDFNPRDLTADERFKLAHELSNPGSNAEAIQTVVEAALGAPIADVRNTLKSVVEEQERKKFAAEAAGFIARYPEFYKTAKNEQLIHDYLIARQMDYTTQNLSLAYEDLLRDELLQAKPTVSVAPAPSASRPRSASTGLPSSGASRPQPKPNEFTADDIYRMTPQEYKRRLESDPQFRASVEKAIAVGRK